MHVILSEAKNPCILPLPLPVLAFYSLHPNPCTLSHYNSIQAFVVGVKISHPSAVTRTVSSIRIPYFPGK